MSMILPSETDRHNVPVRANALRGKRQFEIIETVMRIVLFLIATLISAVLTAGDALVAKVRDIDGLARAANGKNVVFLLSGRITAASKAGAVIDDGTGMTWLHVKPPSDFELHANDTVTLGCEACYQAEKDVLAVTAVKASSIRRGNAASPSERVDITHVVSGQALFKSVTLNGVITDAFRDEIDPTWIFLILESKGSRATITLHDRNTLPMQSVNAVVDKAVAVTGICLPNSGGRRNIGNAVTIDGLDSIRPIPDPPDDPFRYPLRRPITGTVIASWGGKFLFIREDSGRTQRIKLAPDVQPPSPGTRVTAFGFLRQNVFFNVFANATLAIRSEDVAPPEPPADVTPRDLLYDDKGRLMIRPANDGRIIRLQGLVRDVVRPGTDEGRLLLDCGGISIPVEIGRFPAPSLGSRISVAGACLMTSDSDETTGGFIRLNGFSVIPRSSVDIRVLAPPPWWTPGRFLCVIGALLAVLVGIFVWNRALQRLVERRGRQLLRAQIEGERSALRIGERTRLAVELHDSLSQNLTGVGFQLDSFRCARDGDAAAAERHLETAERILGSCRTELRRCLWDLRSDALEESDFTLAIRKVLQPFMDKADVTVRFNVPRARLSDSITHAILRIIRELTANAIVHGKAGCVRVAGSFEDGNVLFSVTDDGCGFDPSACPGPADGHFGIVGIRERVTELQGTFDLASGRTSGTKVRIRLPVAQRQPSGKTPS